MSKVTLVRSLAVAGVGVVALFAGAGAAQAMPEREDEVLVGFESGTAPTAPGTYQWIAVYSGDANWTESGTPTTPGTYRFVATYSGDTN